MADENNPQTKARRAAGKSLGGRPRLYDSPEEMQRAIDKYFKQEGKLSVCGLALALGFDTPRNLITYATRDEYSPVIARAKARIMQYYEELGQDARLGGFSDRMLTRMGLPCVEEVDVKEPFRLVLSRGRRDGGTG